MARAGMANLILEIRKLCNVGTADFSVAGTNYFSDDQIQALLDNYRATWKRVHLEPIPDPLSGSYDYFEYQIPASLRWFEENAASSGWLVEDSAAGSVNSSSYTANYNARLITFTSDTNGADYYLDCRTYDVYKTAGEIWEQKASFVANSVDWQSDNHRISASQEHKHCLAMAKKYKSMGGLTLSRQRRVDEA